MKIGIYTDVHYTAYSSIIRTRGKKYSSRIENCINSINWAEDMFRQNNCDLVVCLGDFFDHNNLVAEEITALNDIKFNDKVKHLFLVGNHEITRSDCTTSSMHVFNNFSFIDVIDKVESFDIDEKTKLIFIPYMLEENRIDLLSNFGQKVNNKNVIMLSHNDIKGLQYGAYVSDVGFNLDDIKATCNMFINGHLHNGQFLNDEETILNLGNLTGQNFSEDATKYEHYACILDTDNNDLKFYENPYAYNFYKIDLTKTDGFDFNKLKNNAVITVKAYDGSDLKETKENINNRENIVASRFIVVPKENDFNIETNSEDLSIDYIGLFNSFIKEKLGSSKVINEELNYIIEL